MRPDPDHGPDEPYPPVRTQVSHAVRELCYEFLRSTEWCGIKRVARNVLGVAAVVGSLYLIETVLHLYSAPAWIVSLGRSVAWGSAALGITYVGYHLATVHFLLGPDGARDGSRQRPSRVDDSGEAVDVTSSSVEPGPIFDTRFVRGTVDGAVVLSLEVKELRSTSSGASSPIISDLWVHNAYHPAEFRGAILAELRGLYAPEHDVVYARDVLRTDHFLALGFDPASVKEGETWFVTRL